MLIHALTLLLWTTQAPAPVDAIAAITSAFRTHRIVALEEPHGDERAHAFRLSLIRDPAFQSAANDILVEFGNSRYQDVIDRFMIGDDVPYTELRQVWENTTQAHAIWDRPIYETFFRAVRAVNAALPAGQKLRVLLGDPAIDWDAVRTADDRLKWLRDPGRSHHPAMVLEREVLAKDRRALVIYGAGHLLRQNPQGPNLIEHVEKTAGVKAFVVVSASLEAAGVKPELIPAGSVVPTTGTSLENQLDAVLHLGPSSSRRMSRLSRELCGDRAYREMRIARMTLAGFRDAAAALARECEAAVQGNPDLSGVWIPSGETPPTPPPAPPGGVPPAPKTISLTIEQTATTIKITRKADSGGREVEFIASFKLDGTESVNQRGLVELRSRTAWQDAALVITSIAVADGRALGEIKEVYRLENGELIVESARKTEAGTFTAKTVHRKEVR